MSSTIDLQIKSLREIDQFGFTAYKGAVKDAIATLERSRWISANERLPERSDNNIVARWYEVHGMNDGELDVWHDMFLFEENIFRAAAIRGRTVLYWREIVLPDGKNL